MIDNRLGYNSGSASPKFEAIAARPEDELFNEQCKLTSGAIEDLGEKATPISERQEGRSPRANDSRLRA
jgi:hypothetical protein